MKAIAKRQGRPAHELFTGRTKAAVPMREWCKRHEPEAKPCWSDRIRQRLFGRSK
jgi:hypothetical protein